MCGPAKRDAEAAYSYVSDARNFAAVAAEILGEIGDKSAQTQVQKSVTDLQNVENYLRDRLEKK